MTCPACHDQSRKRRMVGATGFELQARASQSSAYNERLTKRDSQNAGPIPDHDLQRVIKAWCNLSANLKAAIMAIVGPERAIGVNKLTGINSAAISMLTQSAIDPTALHVCRGESSFFLIWPFLLILAKGARASGVFCRGEIDQLLQICSEKRREFIEWDQFHPVIKVK